jgi:ABC-type nitrate/sulfonate/bicarbonate transport system substrate-binding protein
MTEGACRQMPARLTVGIVSRTFYYVPLWSAIRQRRFAAAGLQVRIEILGHDDPVEAIRAGRCDIAISPPDSVLRDVDGGGDSVILAGNADRLSHRLIAQPEFASVEALRGRRIGVLSRTEGSFFHFQILAEAHGLKFPEEFEVVETGGAPLRHRLLLDKKIDAGLQSLPWVYLEEAAGLRNLCDVSDFVPVWQFNTVNAERRWAEQHIELTQAFLQVLKDASDAFYREPDAMADIAAQEMGVPHKQALRAWHDLVSGRCITRDLSVNIEGLRCVHASLAQAGLTDPDAEVDTTRYRMFP